MKNKAPNPKTATDLHQKVRRSKCRACGLLIKKGEHGKRVDGHWFHADTCLVVLQTGKVITSLSGRRSPPVATGGGCGPNCPHCGGKTVKVSVLAMLFSPLSGEGVS